MQLPNNAIPLGFERVPNDLDRDAERDTVDSRGIGQLYVGKVELEVGLDFEFTLEEYNI